MTFTFMLVAIAANLWAQEPPATKTLASESPAKKMSPLEKFEKTKKEWDTNEADLAKVIKDYRTAEATARGPLYREYQALVSLSRRLVAQLKDDSLNAYAAAPNKNDEVVKTIVGLIVNSNRVNDNRGASEMCLLLIENKCDNKLLPFEYGAALFCLGDDEKAAEYLNENTPDGQMSETAKNCLREIKLRAAEAKADNLPRVKITTNKGDIVLELFENEAPNTVANFISLADSGYYNGTIWHRVIHDFMAQAGKSKDPKKPGPGYRIPCECYEKNHRQHFNGTLAMAHAGRDTAGSQFYITYERTFHLDGLHTVFGRVISGTLNLAKLDESGPEGKDDQIIKIEVVRKQEHEYKPKTLPE
jgi:cyclophilin family peptidyl-prolyl cis-trans isomerase